jgi:hypothetical protein
MKTIREQFVDTCVEAMAHPVDPDSEVQKSQEALTRKLANRWIDGETLEFRLFKAGHAKGREVTANYLNQGTVHSVSAIYKPENDKDA